MSQQQINLSPDLKRLQDEGFEIEIRNGGHLIVHHIPYVNTKCEIHYGKLIAPLTLSNNIALKPTDHVISFMGSYPCNKDGTEIEQLRHANPNQTLFEDIVLNYSFSNKPPNGYNDFYEKIVRYANMISASAKSINKSVTAQTFRPIVSKDFNDVFNYVDTNSSRANINFINSKFNKHKIAIIGLGGTGSYILDLIAKTPVAEIHLFDGDILLQHNAFRCPGAVSIEDLDKQQLKVEYFASTYSKMHKKIIVHSVYVDDDTIGLLDGISFVFICIDSNKARNKIIASLLKKGIDFIDVGLGVNIVDDKLIGMVRTTTGTSSKNDHLAVRIGDIDVDDNEYASNIQIADLNALNANLAVIKWKKLCGFYQDLIGEHHTTYSINVSQLLNNDDTTV